MKSFFTLLLLIIFSSSQAQYKVDWGRAPLNPVPEQYTLNHFKVFGPVASITYINGKITTNFNNQGKASTQTSEFDRTIWIYDTIGHLKQQKYGKNYENKITYETDEIGNIIAITREGGRTQVVNYDKDTLFISKMDGDMPVVKYAYDAKGRVIQEEFFSNGVPNMLSLYQYMETEDGLTVMTRQINRRTKEAQQYIQKFDANGHVVFRNDKKVKYKYDSRGNILSSDDKYFSEEFVYGYED